MTASPTLLEATVRSGEPFALIARDADTVELLTGDVVDVDLLADIPLHDASAAPREVLARVPFRQVVERGFGGDVDLEMMGHVLAGTSAADPPRTRREVLQYLDGLRDRLTGSLPEW